MSTKQKTRLSYPKISLLTAAALVALAQGVSAFGTGGVARTGQMGKCTFALDLQSSYEVRRLYMLRLEQAGGKTVVDGAAGSPSGRSRHGWRALNGTDGDAAEATGFGSYGKAINGVDQFSLDCIGCHDGVGASAINLDIRNRPLDRRSRVDSFTSEHPIGMDYSSYVATGRGYKAVSGDGKMLFINGKVGCLSCHDPLNPQKGHLVAAEQNSSVCHKCHDK